MKAIVFFSIFVLLFTGETKGQNRGEEKALSVFFKEFNLWTYPKKFPDTLSAKLDKGKRIFFYIKNAKGESTFYVINKMNEVFLKGNFSAALDTFKTYGYSIDAMASSKIKIIKYFEPVKDGIWIYYSKKGSIEKKMIYNKGDSP